MNAGYKGHGDFHGTCHGCKRGMVWIGLEHGPTRFVYRDHSYVVGFGTPAQKLVKCEQSGQKVPNLGL